MRGLKLFGVALAVLVLAGAAAVWWVLQRAEGPATLTVAAGAKGTSTYAFLDDLAAVIERQTGDVRLVVRETKGIDENAVLAGLGPAGEVVDTSRAKHTAPEGIIVLPTNPTRGTDLSVIQSDTVVSSEMRLVAPLFRAHFQLIATEASGVKTIHDLARKRIALPPVNSSGFRAFWSVAEHYQVAIEDVQWRSLDLKAATDALSRGTIDAVFVTQSIRSPDVVAMFDELRRRRVAVDFLAVDQAPAMVLRRPFLEASTIERGTYLGFPALPEADTPTAAVRYLLVAHRDTDPNAVEALTRVLMENRFDLMVRNPLAQEIKAPDLGALLAPLHPGAARYYLRDQPSFLESNANTIGIALTVGGILVSLGAWLRSQLTAGRKNRADNFNIAVMDVSRRAREATTSAELLKCRDELDRMIEDIIRALDTDDVTEEGFQSFAFAWEAVRASVSDRLTTMQPSA
jgi:TRAP-type uncharacterized transport system substrate-binding protein